MTSTNELIEALCRELDERAHEARRADTYFNGERPLSYLSPEAADKLRLQVVEANYCRLVTSTVADRLLVEGFSRGGESLSDVWGAWSDAGMGTEHRKAILEALITGRSYVTVWGSGESPVVSVDSASEMTHRRDPLTRELTHAWKRIVRDGRGYGVLWEADKVTRFEGPEAPSGFLPSTGWRAVEVLPNPLGVVPVVPLVNSHRLLDEVGVPQSKVIWALQDLLNKILSDMAVASEAVAGPRRWATGLQFELDEDGNAINPFDSEPGSVWTSEQEQTKFGQFPAAEMGGYETTLGVVIRQIGALSGLPDHLLGIESADPSSAEQIRAATESLSQTVAEKQRLLSASFARVAALIEAVSTGGAVRGGVSVEWRSSEDQTFSQLADGLSKLYAGGLLPLETVWQRLGFTPEQIRTMRQQQLTTRIESL